MHEGAKPSPPTQQSKIKPVRTRIRSPPGGRVCVKPADIKSEALPRTMEGCTIRKEQTE